MHVGEVHAERAGEEDDGGGEEGDEGEGVERAVHHVLLQLGKQLRHVVHPILARLRTPGEHRDLPAGKVDFIILYYKL